jgi:N-glycosidase YbiA
MIQFYDPADNYGCFSNFSKHPLTLEGKQWATSEHYFQAMKFWPHRPDLIEAARKAPSPGKVAELGRQRTNPLRADWESHPVPEMWTRVPYTQPVFVRDGVPRDIRQEPIFARTKDIVMFEAVYAKFTQNTELKQILLSTGQEQLVENAIHDPYWGWGASRKGQNKLGRILMMVRGYLKVHPGA